MGRKILIIDDDQDFIGIFKTAFQKKDYEIFAANDGGEGLAVVEKNAVDLILLDIIMPGLNGYEFLRALRGTEKAEGRPPTPVLVHTAKEGMEELFAFEGIKEYLVKPVRIDALTKKIEQYLGPEG